MLETGIKGKQETVVTEDKTARVMGSGELDVFATPAMIALIEETAWKSVAEHLEPGEGTVGTKLDVSHVSAAPLGLTIFSMSLKMQEVSLDRQKQGKGTGCKLADIG